MPSDICMCAGGDCPQKVTCLRFTATIYGRQDFFGTPPYLQKAQGCAYYLDERPSHESIKKLAEEYWQNAGYPSGKDLDFWFSAETFLINLRRNG